MRGAGDGGGGGGGARKHGSERKKRYKQKPLQTTYTNKHTPRKCLLFEVSVSRLVLAWCFLWGVSSPQKSRNKNSEREGSLHDPVKLLSKMQRGDPSQAIL